MRARTLLSYAVASVAIPLVTGAAWATDWRPVAADPERFIGHKIDLGTAFCGGGGPDGVDPGLYQCSLGAGAFYVETRKLAKTKAARAVEKSCGDLDVWQRSPTCRFRITLIPRSVRKTREIDPKRTLPIIGSDEIQVR